MKRYVRNADLIKIDVYYVLEKQDTSIAAAAYSSPITDAKGWIINESEYARYQLFVQNIDILLDYYDLSVTEQPKPPAQINKKTLQVKFQSTYYWLAMANQVANNNVPEYLQFRISDHYQDFSPEGRKEANNQAREFAETIKKPNSKRKQRFQLDEVSVNDDKFNNYDDALTDVEKKIRKWLANRRVDISQYETLVSDDESLI